jgi:hypothetical protein
MSFVELTHTKECIEGKNYRIFDTVTDTISSVKLSNSLGVLCVVFQQSHAFFSDVMYLQYTGLKRILF